MCGNGVRCFARFIAEIENLHGKQRYTCSLFSLSVLHSPGDDPDGLTIALLTSMSFGDFF